MVLTGEALLTFSFATNLFHKLVLVSDRSTKTWLIETFLQAMEQTEIREEEVRIYFQSIRPSPPLSINFSSKVLPADYVFLSLSVATDILGEFKETLEPKTDFTTSNQTGGALLGILWGLLTAVDSSFQSPSG